MSGRKGEMPRKEMVGWFNPIQLLRAGPQVAVSATIGRHVDYRLIEALTPSRNSATSYDHTVIWRDEGMNEIPSSKMRDEIWVDFVADTGDGWNSTYAIACAISQDWEFAGPKSTTSSTKRGDLLVFGGDQVYPVASLRDYKERFIAPFERALKWTEEPHPHAFFLPGNHDWYDNLVAFSRLFCAGAWFGGWRTQQDRSYFAIRLPHRWWLMAPDLQLGSYIDAGQIEYFRKVASQMAEGDRVILCCSEPFWVYSEIYARFDKHLYEDNSLAFFERNILNRKGCIKVYLAGDLHHYRRHQSDDGTQKISSGGGGAFLSPTHGPDVSFIDETWEGDSARRFKLEKSWPDREVSKGLCWRNLFFPVLNPLFGILTSLLYALIATTLLGNLRSGEGLSAVWAEVGKTILERPGALTIVVVTLLGFVLFTDTRSKAYRWGGGIVHGLVHEASAVVIGWLAVLEISALELELPWRQLVLGVAVLGGGWVWGSFIFGVYLLVSLNVFGRHSNEAFASLRIEGWKHFLRLHIDNSGKLTIHAIGLRRVRKDKSGCADPELFDVVHVS